MPFTDCISEINNTEIDNEKYIDVVIPMYNLIEYIAIIIQKDQEVAAILQRRSKWQYNTIWII